MKNQSITVPATSYLTFQNNKITIIDRNGQVWITSSDIAAALGFTQSTKVNQIYQRHKDEFTEQMTVSLNLRETNGCSVSETDTREVRIFSLRGAHLIAMFARTERAAEFRRWVLDLLDRETATPPAQPGKPTQTLAPKSKVDDKKISRINQHAWSLAHAYYESTRTQMIADINMGLHNGPIEDWKPQHAINEVLVHIEVIAVTAKLHAEAIRREGHKLAELAGVDYDAATDHLPRI